MVTYEIVLDWNDGRSETIAVSETETILDAAESAELGLPFGCLTGRMCDLCRTAPRRKRSPPPPAAST